MTEAEEQAVAGSQRKKLAIIDGKSVFYRGYYAMPNLATKDGTPTGGVYGFASMALEVLRRLKPDYVCVAWDKPKTNIRKRLELYPAYKAGRKPPPPDFYEQIPILHGLLEAFGWPLYELDDYEADDIMGTLAVQASAKDIDTMLITSDLDMLQLVNSKVKVFALKKGLSNIELYSAKSFTAKYGIRPDQFLDLKALKGDSSDNIPGVPGIGEKGGLDLIKSYETLDGVYENIDLTRETIRKKLEAGKESAYLSKKLASIWTDAPIKLDLKALDIANCNPAAVQEQLQKLEFRSLARQLPEIMQISPKDQSVHVANVAFQAGQNIIIDSAAKLKELKLPKADRYYVYTQTAGKHGRKPSVLLLSADAKTTFSFDLTKLATKQVSDLISSLKTVVGHDLKASLEVFLELNSSLPEVAHDTLIGAFLLNSLRRDLSLTEQAQVDFGYDGSSFEDLDASQVILRAPEIIAVIIGLYELQSAELAKYPKVSQLAKTVEWPVIPVLARMEYTGIQLDSQSLKAFSDEISDTISDLEQQIYGFADEQFNIASPGQLATILFEKLQLPTAGIKKGKTGYSTAASELAKLRQAHPIIDLISQYREVTKLKSTYVDSLPKQADEQSRVHTNFSLTIAQTGRLSSSDPNLQNIPVRTDLGKRIRAAFVAGSKQQLVSADYSQFELRIAAALSGDQGMIDSFNRDADIHTETAAAIYGIQSSDVTKQQRYSAKAVNFGIMYGQGPHGLSAGTGMAFGEAKDFIERYFQIRPGLKKYIDELREMAKTEGYVETMLGRRRPTPDVHSSNFIVREAAYRAAVNMPLQGTAADLMKLAMVEVDKHLPALQAQQLLQVHDSILVQCPTGKVEDVSKLLTKAMEGIYKLPVKLKVEVTSGQNWGQL